MIDNFLPVEVEIGKSPLFQLGRIYANKSLVKILKGSDLLETVIFSCIERHASGDFGIIGDHDSDMNWANIRADNGLILSLYKNSLISEGLAVVTEHGVTVISPFKELEQFSRLLP